MTENIHEFILNELISWLIGIEEDDPLPYEIAYGTFFCCIGKNENSLRVVFNETKKDNADFQPLEAQYFYCKEFIDQSTANMNKNLMTFLINEALKNDHLLKCYKNVKFTIEFVDVC